jgi:delta8-fatty-acid desaturase
LSDPESTTSDSGSSRSPDSDADGLHPLDDIHSLASSVTSICNSSDGDNIEALDKKIGSASDLLGPDASGMRQRILPSPARQAKVDAIRRLSPSEYTTWAVEQDIDRDLSEYPSLEPDVQQDITRKYRALHQKVEDMGYYDCPYIEYGKECIRYITLFTGFIVLLRYGWYTASAICLGVFWVCPECLFTSPHARTKY